MLNNIKNELQQQMDAPAIIMYLFNENRGKWLKNNEIIALLRLHQCDLLTGAEIRQVIKKLRLQGNLIIAGTQGYMLTDNVELVKKYLKSRWCEVTQEMKIFRVLAKKAECLGLIPVWEQEMEQE